MHRSSQLLDFQPRILGTLIVTDHRSYHTENESSYYRPEWSFWQAGIGTGAKYNASTFSPRVADWTNVDDVVLHVIHYDW